MVYAIYPTSLYAIVGQDNLPLAVKAFREEVLKSRRRLLLEKAQKSGGTDLVKKWIGLHVVGKKQEQIKQIAMEAGFL